MEFTTFSILAGSEACNARCPFCVSKMTPPNGMTQKEPEVNWRNFDISCRYAETHGATTALITGKGEPTLFPKQITKYLENLEKHNFPLVELQTNGIPFWENRERYEPFLQNWYEKGLTTIAISMVHYDPEKNREIYLPYRDEYIDLPGLIEKLHDTGFSVRLACVMLNGYIDSPGELEKLIGFAKENNVEQLTARPVNVPERSEDADVYAWTSERMLSEEQQRTIKEYLDREGSELISLPHAATVYDVNGQNVCLSNCLTRTPDKEEIRQLIFFPDGHLRYDWEKPGAILF